MTQKRRQDIQPAFVVDIVLSHLHGKRPAYVDDFRDANNGSWRDFTDSTDVNKTSSPPRDEPLGESDLTSRKFDGSDDSLDVPDAAAFDVGSSDDYAVAVYVRRTSVSSAETICQKWDGSAGYRLVLQSDGTVDFIVSDGTNTDTVSTSTSVDDGSPHLVTASVDRGGSQITIEVDGTREGSPSLSAGDLSNSSDFVVANSSFAGTIQAVSLHGTWISEPQAAFLDALLRTGDVAAGTFQRLMPWFRGHPSFGWKRNLPTYLTDAFGAGGPDFWYNVDRHIHGVDGEGVVQLPDFSGSNFAVQRTSSNRPVARGNATRGKPLDYIEFSSGDNIEQDAFLTDAAENGDGFSVFFVAQVTTEGVAAQQISHGDPSDFFGQGGIRCAIATNSEVIDYRILDTSGAGTNVRVSLSESTDTEKYAVSIRYNSSNDEMKITAQSPSNSRITNNATAPGGTLHASDFVGKIGELSDGGASSHRGPFWEIIESTQFISDSKTNDVMDALVSNWGI